VAKPGGAMRQLLVGHAEALAVPALKVNTFPQVSLDPLNMQRMGGEPVLVLLP
jgi:hypothetical protein